jgi:hypothetical protein
MSVEIAALCGRLVAVEALEAGQASVNAPMPRHAAAPREFLPADVALIGLNIGNSDKICS